jgi:hypothetical protein
MSKKCGILDVSQPYDSPRSDTGIGLFFLYSKNASCVIRGSHGGEYENKGWHAVYTAGLLTSHISRHHTLEDLNLKMLLSFVRWFHILKGYNAAAELKVPKKVFRPDNITNDLVTVS